MRDIAAFANDPAAFRAELVIPSARGPARLGEVIAPFQDRDFAELDKAFIAVRDGRQPQPGRFFLERCKGSSKDSDLAVMLLWLLAFCPRPLTCQVGAADADQADELRKAAKGILRLNTWLDAALEVQALRIINPRTESRADIIPADVAGSHGARPDVLILNELSHVTKQEFAANLMDNAAKVPNGLVVIATNAGFIPSWQHQWRENARTSPRWFFSAFTQPAPWLDVDELEEARKRNTPARFARLWQGEWVAEGDALPLADIDAAIDRTLSPATAKQHGMIYVAGVDLALSRDNAGLCVLAKSLGWTERLVKPRTVRPRVFEALADLGLMDSSPEQTESIFHEGDGKLRLAATRLWKPAAGQIDLQAVENSLVELHQRFGFALVLLDIWQAGQMVQRLQRRGVPAMGQAFTTGALAEMASEVICGLRDGRIILYPDDALVRDLRRAQLIERANGSRLQWERGKDGHGDLGTAFALACLAARRLPAGPSRIEGSLAWGNLDLWPAETEDTRPALLRAGGW